jgi:hypothetical protein
MDILACQWMARHYGHVRIVHVAAMLEGIACAEARGQTP